MATDIATQICPSCRSDKYQCAKINPRDGRHHPCVNQIVICPDCGDDKCPGRFEQFSCKLFVDVETSDKVFWDALRTSLLGEL